MWKYKDRRDSLLCGGRNGALNMVDKYFFFTMKIELGLKNDQAFIR